MRFLRRGSSDDGLDDRLARFWAWWATARDGIAADIPAGRVAQRAGEISNAVTAIDKRLAWELGKGKTATHMLVVSPEGSAEVRPIAIAWHRSAPPPDATWEYHPSRQPGEPATLQVAGATVQLADMRAVTSWDETRELLSVRLWHPAFDPLPENVRGQISFLFLDNLLGEDDVERWIGAIEMDPSAQAGRTPAELVAEVRRQAESATGDQWALLQTTDDAGGPVIIRLHSSVKRIDYPFAANHLEATMDSHLDDPDRARGKAASDAAEELGADLKGAAILCAHVTDRRRRVIHFACEDGQRSLELATFWADRHRDLNAKVRVEPDPTWAFRRTYGG
jgi:hypothetical protein